MIYDAFTFFNELDLLEVRLHTLQHVVDTFILVESSLTFSRNPKPLFYWENRDRFAAFNKRIIHVVVETMPDTDNRWDCEVCQRNAIQLGLVGSTADDLVLISDVDEIPFPTAIGLVGESAAFSMRTYYYNLNTRLRWYGIGTTASRMWAFDTPQKLRDQRAVLPRIEDACWHFSYFGNANQIAEKIGAFAHAEYDSTYFRDIGRLDVAIRERRDLFDRPYLLDAVPLDASLPPYILDHLDRFPHWVVQ